MEPMYSSPSTVPEERYFCNSFLPLAVYREVVAHLRQVNGVEAGLLPQTSQTFDYRQSQVGGVWLRYTDRAEAIAHQHVDQILSYYGDRYGPWEPVSR